MKQLGSFPAHFVAGVLTTCLVGAVVLYGTENWKKYAPMYSTAYSQFNMDLPNIPSPRPSRIVLAPMATVDDAAGYETENTVRSVSESDLTVEGQIQTISTEYRATKSEATRKRLKEQLSILMQNSPNHTNLEN